MLGAIDLADAADDDGTGSMTMERRAAAKLLALQEAPASSVGRARTAGRAGGAGDATNRARPKKKNIDVQKKIL
eukprot:SAG11_NODE_2158_length_3731_cov_3.221641_5_plen_74_part_00